MALNVQYTEPGDNDEIVNDARRVWVSKWLFHFCKEDHMFRIKSTTLRTNIRLHGHKRHSGSSRIPSHEETVYGFRQPRKFEMPDCNHYCFKVLLSNHHV